MCCLCGHTSKATKEGENGLEGFPVAVAFAGSYIKRLSEHGGFKTFLWNLKNKFEFLEAHYNEDAEGPSGKRPKGRAGNDGNIENAAAAGVGSYDGGGVAGANRAEEGGATAPSNGANASAAAKDAVPLEDLGAATLSSLPRQRQIMITAVWTLNYEGAALLEPARRIFDAIGCMYLSRIPASIVVALVAAEEREGNGASPHSGQAYAHWVDTLLVKEFQLLTAHSSVLESGGGGGPGGRLGGGG